MVSDSLQEMHMRAFLSFQQQQKKEWVRYEWPIWKRARGVSSLLFERHEGRHSFSSDLIC